MFFARIFECPTGVDPSEDDYSLEEREVRRTVLRVVRDHLRPQRTAVSWSSHKFGFEGATFERGDLTGIRLDGEGHMTFHGVTFLGEYFHFGEVDFNGRPIWFTQATFDCPRVSFRNARFGSSRVNFDGAMFVGGHVDFAGVRADTGQVTFIQAHQSGAAVDWGPFTPPTTP
jgi:uncharacterized Zn-binding protein involved in type VI secretion